MNDQLSSVLIVEDNPGDVLLLEAMLTDAFQGAIHIDKAENVSQAGLLLATRHSLVLLDLTLPDSWGADTFRKLRALAPQSPIVVLTGLQDESVALALVREGAQDYLTKGQFDQGMLARVVRYAWERQRIEAELLERRVWWETIIQVIPDAVVVSTDARVVFANEAASRLWKIPADEILRRSLEDLCPEGFLSQASPRGTLIVDAEGHETPVEVSHSSFQLGTEHLLATVVRDLTERRRLEQQLLHTQKMEAVGHLGAGIAHDFNNLLSVVSGNLDLLKHMLGDNNDALRRLERAQAAVVRGADLTRRLLSFSRAQDLRPKLVRIPSMMDNLLDMIRRTLGPEIRIESRIDPQLPSVYTDPSELENVLLNLALNARDAMPTGGLLLFSGEPVVVAANDFLVQSSNLAPGEYVEIGVTDTGTGMPRSVLEKAFEPFFTTKEKGRGTGLGLSMVYGFTRQSGGTTRIYSEPGQGTSVKFFLPVATDPTSTPTTQVRTTFQAPQGARALVVDDEPDLLEVASSFLTRLGFEVLRASDGVSALRLVESETELQLLLTDVLMPGGVNGAQLAEALRARYPRLRVVFTSGFPSQALADRSLHLDSEMVGKPYIEEDLVRALARVFNPE